MIDVRCRDARDVASNDDSGAWGQQPDDSTHALTEITVPLGHSRDSRGPRAGMVRGYCKPGRPTWICSEPKQGKRQIHTLKAKRFDGTDVLRQATLATPQLRISGKDDEVAGSFHRQP